MSWQENQSRGNYPTHQGQQHGGNNYSGNQGYPGHPTGNQGYPGYPTGNQGYPGSPTSNQGHPGYPTGNQGYPGSPGQNQGHPGYPIDQGQGYGGQGYGSRGTPPPAGFGFPPPERQFSSEPASVSKRISDDSTSSKGKDEKTVLDFSDKSIRHGFIRKVYSILVVQLLFTSGVIALFMYNEATKRYVQDHMEIFWISLATLIVTIIVMACCGSLRRKAPLNYIFLFIFTLAESILMGITAGSFDTDVVLMAAGVTLGICLALTLFAFQTKIDFTFCSASIFMMIIILLICGTVAAIFPSDAMLMVYASLGVLVFCLYLIYDTQTMIGGKHEHSISPEEYIFAALSLYLDVMRIFTYILMIFGLCKK